MATHDSREPSPMVPGWKTMALVGAFYLAALAVATWPAFATFGSTLPSIVDPLAHIWTMRWNKECLLHGRLPFVCPDIQYPVGASLGTLPPMHFQTLLYIPLSIAFDNDVLCYNIIRTIAFLLTGLGTFVLIWNVLRCRMAAALGGLTAMLGGPMSYFSHSELEQITVGWFPIFLVAWLRFVDRPTRRGLAASVAFYLLVAMSAPYFGVFAIFPAGLYVAWRAIAEGRSGVVPWVKARLGWFAGFAGLAGPVLALLFSNQIWAMTHGFSMTRPEAEFWACGAPFWSYVFPSTFHWLGRAIPFHRTGRLDHGAMSSYLGVVSLALIAYAAIRRVPFSRRGFWWSAFALLVVLSLGAHATIGGLDISLPAYWLKKYFAGFRMIRVPARFNLFAAVAASVVAAAGLKHLLARIPGRPSRIAAFAGIMALATADLSTVPYLSTTIRPMPACYEVVRRADPDATFLDAPQFNSGAFQLPSLCTYWQSIHGGKTSAGYTAFNNARYDNLLFFNSPFDAFKLGDPYFPMVAGSERIELAEDVDFRSYAWLYLKVHNLRYVVLHHRPGAFPEFLVHLPRLQMMLQDARIYQDGDAAVYDREKMATPTKPVFLYSEGWGDRLTRQDRWTCMVGPVARLVVYNPTPDRPLSIALEAAGNKKDRAVRLTTGGRVLARWEVSASETSRMTSRSFYLPAGLHELAIESDGADKPSRIETANAASHAPFSLWVRSIGLISGDPRAVAARPRESGAR